MESLGVRPYLIPLTKLYQKANEVQPMIGMKESFGTYKPKSIWFHKLIDTVIRDSIKRRPLYVCFVF